MIKIGNIKLNYKEEKKINTSRVLAEINTLKNTRSGLGIWLMDVMHKVQLLQSYQQRKQGTGTTEFQKKSAMKNQRTA